MRVNQVYEILNTIAQEELGETVTVAEDLSNVVDVGRAFENLDGALDNYVRKLHDRIGRMVFVDRVYAGRAPSILMDGWEYGSILAKVRTNLPEAEENESWELQDGTSYDPNIFKAPEVSVKFFNNRVTFEIQVSTTRKQVMSAFANATELNAFYSMIYTAIQNSMTMKLDSLIMRTINSFIADTLYSEFPGGVYTGASGVRAVNLLYLYNSATGESLTAEPAMTDPDFLRFAVATIRKYMDRMQVMSTLFNVGGTVKFTPVDRMKVVMLSDFIRNAGVYLYDGAGQFNTENLRLPESIDAVPYWQGSGVDYDWDDMTAIKVTSGSGHVVSITGVVGAIFDRDALGVSNLDRRVTTNYNPKAEFFNEWHKADAGYFTDLDENGVVFFLA